MMRKPCFQLVLVIFVIFLNPLFGQELVKPAAHGLISTKEKLTKKLNQHYFIENKGQWNREVEYSVKKPDQNYWVRKGGFRVDMYHISHSNLKIENGEEDTITDEISRWGQVWDMNILHHRKESSFETKNRASFYHNYIIGNDKTKWASRVGLFEEVLERGVLNGVDIRYYSKDGKDLEYDLIIHPDGNVSEIQFLLKGIDGFRLNPKGEIELKTSYFGYIPISKPIAYQFINHDTIFVPCRYILSGDTISFSLGSFNQNYDLIIDPVVKYSTYIDCLGCTGCLNYSYDIDVNDSLEAIITGKTYYNTYPVTTGAYKSTMTTGIYDVFLSKLTANGDNLLYSTFFGGSSGDYGYGVAFDSQSNIIFTGYTQSLDFPLLNNLFPIPSALPNAVPFVTKLDSSGGALIFSSVLVLNTSSSGKGSGVIADKYLNVYVTGYANSASFPTTAGALRSVGSFQDGFLMKLNSIGGLLFSTFIGGTNSDVIRGIDLDDKGYVYLVGNSTSTDFHLTVPGYNKVKPTTNSQDVVVCKIKDDGSSMIYATYIGGISSETGTSIAVDEDGNSFFTGHGASTNYPTTAGVFKSTPSSGDIFVSSLDSTGTILRASTAIGFGSCYGIDVDECGFVVLSGYTSSSSYPLTSDAFKKTISGVDNIVTVLDKNLKTLTFSTFYGGSSTDYGEASVSVKQHNLIISGTTHSTDFPTTSGAFQTARFSGNSCDAPVVFAFNKLCFISEPTITANPLFFCDSTARLVTLKGRKTVGGCNSDTANVIIKWSKGYARSPIGSGDSVSLVLKLNDTIYGQAIDTFNLCKSKEFQFVTQYIYSVIDVNICSGQSYLFNGVNRFTSGTYKDTFLTGLNCDSVVILKLTVLVPVYSTVTRYICRGDSTYWKGSYLKTSGIYKDTFTSSKGCDSIVTLYLNYTPVRTYTIVSEICNGDSFYWKGAFIKLAGSYYDTLISSANCDSIVTLVLIVKYPRTNSSYINICVGDSFHWEDSSFFTSGSHMRKHLGSNGCDSFNYLFLTVWNPTFDTFRVNMCQGTNFPWNDQELGVSGYYPDTLSSIHGCDSFVWLNLIVHSPIYISIDTAICSNHFFEWESNFYIPPDTLRDTTVSMYGCDSFTTYYLSTKPVKYFSFYDTSCRGATYIWNGLNIQLSGIYLDTFSASNGCDSIVSLYLYVKPNSIYLKYDTICQGDSVRIKLRYYRTAGVYQDTFINHIGCDSIIHLNLFVKPYTFIDSYITICMYDTVTFNGLKIASSGIYFDTLYSANNIYCDTILRLYLTAIPLIQTLLTDTICQGQYRLWAGDTLRIAGNYQKIFASKEGCDSFVILSLHLKPKPRIQLNACFVVDDSFYFLGKYYKVAGTYIDSSSHFNICDTVYELSLKAIYPIYRRTDTFSCISLLINGNIYTKNDSLKTVLTTISGCDSLIKMTYIHIAIPVKKDTIKTYFCDTFTFWGMKYNTSKQFYDTVISRQGLQCDSIIKVSAFIKFPKPKISIDDTVLSMIRGDRLTISAKGGQRYRWSTSETTSSISISPRNTHYYYVIGWNEYCWDSASIKIIVISNECRVEFPTAFSPNGDGYNDLFLGRSFEGAKITSLKIFNRLGQLLFYTVKEDEGWDGTYKHVLQNSEPYFYTYEAELCIPGKRTIGEGNFLLTK